MLSDPHDARFRWLFGRDLEPVTPRPRRADPPLNFLIVFGRRRLGGSIDPSVVTALSQAIQTQEGYYPGDTCVQKQQSGKSGIRGSTGGVGGGWGLRFLFELHGRLHQALQNQIVLDATRGTDINGNPTTTVSQLIGSHGLRRLKTIRPCMWRTWRPLRASIRMLHYRAWGPLRIFRLSGRSFLLPSKRQTIRDSVFLISIHPLIFRVPAFRPRFRPGSWSAVRCCSRSVSLRSFKTESRPAAALFSQSVSRSGCAVRAGWRE